MSGIANIRFEPPLGFQTQGGPGWKTEIIPLASGAEARNALWARPLKRWSVMGVPLTGAAMSDIQRFFNARSGPHEGFRFRDPFGYASGDSVTAEDTALGTGDGVTTTFQLSLNDGAETPRDVTRPVAASVMIAIEGVETSAFSVDDATGIVTFDTPPGVDAILTAGFEYDLPVRFASDRLEFSQPTNGAVQLVRLELVELREGA